MIYRYKSLALASTCIAALSFGARAETFNISGGDLASALDAYVAQTGVQLILSEDAVKGARTRGVKGNLSPDEALSRLLSGTGFTTHREDGAIGIVRSLTQSQADVIPLQFAQAAPARASVETVTVTSSKLGGADVQSIPIAITALSQEQLTSRQIAGGPDLIKEVPNLTFTKTNFTGYSINIRGIGTQAISVTTDPAVAVSFNDTPFIRNHFFEQEFYDVAQVEVLRGPQGTLYGRNATAGVVNVTSAVPTDHFEAMASADFGNYKNRRLEGMINLPLSGDKLMLRLAGEWTKRDGYSFNSLTDSSIDGRDLWSGRASVRWQPAETFHADFVWEHFQEDDDRMRSAKQLCKRFTPPTSVLGQATDIRPAVYLGAEAYLNQICAPGSLYSSDAFGVPDSLALPYYGGLSGASIGAVENPLTFSSGTHADAYAGTTQSHNLRVIESSLEPQYKAKNDTLELNAEWRIAPALTLSSETGYNRDFLWSTEDFNRFNTQPGVFEYYPFITADLTTPDGNYRCFDGTLSVGGNFCANPDNADQTGIFCDPQLGCSNRLVGQDLSEERSWQLSQEVRLSSNFQGPFNFSFGGNYMHYETDENYYVFFNTLSMYAAVDGLAGRNGVPWIPGVSHNQRCIGNGHQLTSVDTVTNPEMCLGYIDPNPITSLDNQGHNYFLSQNPYNLNSYAIFGETYYNVTKDVKLTAGLRWTDDQKHFTEIPSELLTLGYGYPSSGAIDQEWKKWTGRIVADWSPKISFTDQSMFYASYAHGYKAGGANPPSAILLEYQTGDISDPTHPATFEPEYNDAFELGTKNSLLDGGLTFNGDIFFYNYKGYQISQIVDRTSVNLNFDATVKGAEIQASWEPVPGLKFGFSGGYQDARLASGSKAIDLMDRTAGNTNWILVKPFVTQASNCVAPAYVVSYLFNPANTPGGFVENLIPYLTSLCGVAYNQHLDPISGRTYHAYPTGNIEVGPFGGPAINPTYPGFDPLAGTPGDPYVGQNTYNGVDYGPTPNNGAGFYKDIGGNQLPNAPHFTTSFTADYSTPISADWAATLHGDFYWQSQSWARVFNAVNDRIHGYTNVNLALILNDSSGWQLMGYVKNIFNTTAITGTFLNSDDTGLTTNIFLTDPRLFGVRVTKNFGAGDGGSDTFSSLGGEHPKIWVQLGGDYNAMLSAGNDAYNPDYIRPGGSSLVGSHFTGVAPAGTQTMTELMTAAGLASPSAYQKTPSASLDWEGKLIYQPEDSNWVLKAGVRYGRSSRKNRTYQTVVPGERSAEYTVFGKYKHCTELLDYASCHSGHYRKFVNATGQQNEQHTIMDFEAGVNVGLGSFGTGTISGGLRAAQFTSGADFEINSDPEYVFETTGQYHNVYENRSSEHRSFHGMGPQVTWDANQVLFSNTEGGEFTLDWGANAAVLFGRQSMNAQHFSSYCHVNGVSGGVAGCITNLPSHTKTTALKRTRRKTVPNLGGYIGASARYKNAKLSFGYRADTFFGAMDGGQATAADHNRGFYGPYINVSIGLGN